MQRPLPRLLKVTLLLAYASTQAVAQTPTVPPPRNLSEFEGLYEYHDGGTAFMVASGDRLVAIIDESKYPLRPATRGRPAARVLPSTSWVLPRASQRLAEKDPPAVAQPSGQAAGPGNMPE